MAGEKAPPQVNPFEAAKQLRVLTRGARDDLKMFVDAGGEAGGVMQRDRARRARRYRDSGAAYDQNIKDDIVAVREAAATRRVSDVTSALATLDYRLAEQRAKYHDMWAYCETIFRRIEGGGEAGEGGPVNVKTALNTLNKIVNLVQVLPTSDDLPKSSAETTLRAMVAILRHSGVPGTENLQWKEVLNAKEETNHDDPGEGPNPAKPEVQEGAEQLPNAWAEAVALAGGTGGGNSPHNPAV